MCKNVTDEKICPFMSKNKISYINEDGGEEVEFAPVICQKERCMAWESHHPVDEYDTFEGGRCRLIP